MAVWALLVVVMAVSLIHFVSDSSFLELVEEAFFVEGILNSSGLLVAVVVVAVVVVVAAVSMVYQQCLMRYLRWIYTDHRCG